VQRNENASRNYNTPRKPPHQKPQFSPKECGYCKRREHEEKDCRTKAFHLQRGQQNFHGRPTLNRPPDQASHSHAVEQEHRNKELTRDQEEPSLEPRIALKIPGFKQITFLIDTGSDISLIHEAYLENKNLPRVDPIVIFGVTTHSIKTKYGVIIEMFGKKHIFHVLDNRSPVKHQVIRHRFSHKQ